MDEYIKKTLTESLTHNAVEKRKVYIDDPSEAPEGAEVQEGQRGGLYYISEGGSGESESSGSEESSEEAEEESEDVIDVSEHFNETRVVTAAISDTLGSLPEDPESEYDFPDALVGPVSTAIVNSGSKGQAFDNAVSEVMDRLYSYEDELPITGYDSETFQEAAGNYAREVGSLAADAYEEVEE